MGGDAALGRPDMPAAEGPSDSDQMGRIHARLSTLEETIGSLRASFDERLQYDAVKEKAFDVLYAKLREQENDQSASLKRNLIRSLLLLHDHMQAAEAALEEDSPGKQRMGELRTELLDILYAEDVEPLTAAGVEFDRTRQQALGFVTTDDPALDNTVERILREGFSQGGRVLRPQAVMVRRFQSSIDQTLAKGG